MNDQLLSIITECQKGIKEFREYLELCVATQEKSIRAARILHYLDRVESGEILSLEEFSCYENLSGKTLATNMKVMLIKWFYSTKNYSANAKSLLLKMYRKDRFEFLHRYIFTSNEGAKK
jgi:hypothetical protein